MAVARRWDLVADRRLIFVEYFVFLDEDFTGATYDFQVRLTPDTPGSPLVALSTVVGDTDGVRLLYEGTDTVENHVSARRLGTDIYSTENPVTGDYYTDADNLQLSQLRVLVGLTGMASLPPAPETGDSLDLAYDLIVTRSGGIGIKEATGKFTVAPTVFA